VGEVSVPVALLRNSTTNCTVLFSSILTGTVTPPYVEISTMETCAKTKLGSSMDTLADTGAISTTLVAAEFGVISKILVSANIGLISTILISEYAMLEAYIWKALR
jgi:hypothetical protein